MRSIAFVIIFSFGLAGQAEATPIQVSNRMAFAPSDAIDWAQLPESAGPYGPVLNVLSTNGLFVTANDGVGFNRLTEGVSWFGNFAPGSALIWTSLDGTNANTSGALVLNFATPVQGVGANIQANYYGPFVGQLELFSGNASLGTFSINALSTDRGDGSAPYLGVVDTSALITSAVFRISFPAQDCADLALNCGFAINQLDIRSVVPEPATISLLGLGLAALGFLGRRRRSG